ncbi:hypothetical protein PF010_g2734 [Phytophthora fragariae]|uniref:Uncharacterized protein n=1 Tax=Phytophthora fragariae TaxID=53985 RepID=A0A6G0LW83_9STRA|nr:hypothetical protein PF010_g2734 [Phytophthora fragariae]KAE9248539.1 hypothetical protein PF004_g3811 [Phytophthora fragariae]
MANASVVSDPKLIASVQANATAIARLEEHNARPQGERGRQALGGQRVTSLLSATKKISTLEENIETLIANH